MYNWIYIIFFLNNKLMLINNYMLTYLYCAEIFPDSRMGCNVTGVEYERGSFTCEICAEWHGKSLWGAYFGLNFFIEKTILNIPVTYSIYYEGTMLTHLRSQYVELGIHHKISSLKKKLNIGQTLFKGPFYHYFPYILWKCVFLQVCDVERYNKTHLIKNCDCSDVFPLKMRSRWTLHELLISSNSLGEYNTIVGDGHFTNPEVLQRAENKENMRCWKRWKDSCNSRDIRQGAYRTGYSNINLKYFVGYQIAYQPRIDKALVIRWMRAVTYYVVEQRATK